MYGAYVATVEDAVEEVVNAGSDCEDCWVLDMSVRWLRGTEGVRDALMTDCRNK